MNCTDKLREVEATFKSITLDLLSLAQVSPEQAQFECDLGDFSQEHTGCIVEITGFIPELEIRIYQHLLEAKLAGFEGAGFDMEEGRARIYFNYRYQGEPDGVTKQS